MRVHVHTLCWNDRPMLEFFFRHYEPWVDRFYVFDDGSTDGSWEFLSARPDVVLARTPRCDPDSWVASARTIYNSDWKRSRGEADWVIVTNVDEHLHHPHMRQYLEASLASGATLLPAPGYQMVTESYPLPGSLLWRDHPYGAPNKEYSRLAIFRPDKIAETNYTPGRHCAYFQGEIVAPAAHEIANLHYKYLGVDETYARHREQGERLGSRDRAERWGGHYLWSAEYFRAHFERTRQACVNVTQITRHDPALFWWPHVEGV